MNWMGSRAVAWPLLWMLGTSCVAAQASPVRVGGAQPNRVVFSGLRRIPESTVRAALHLEVDGTISPMKLRSAVAVLHHTGWFDSIEVREGASKPNLLVFSIHERPFLAAVEFHGSRLLDGAQIDALLHDAGVDLALARPANPVVAHRAAFTITRALNALGHPAARVTSRFQHAGDGAVQLVFALEDGPYLPVRTLRFSGVREVPDGDLKQQMRGIRPNAWFAGLRKKNVYTPQKMAADATLIQDYLRDRGYPLARVGAPLVRRTQHAQRAWWPWPHTVRRPGLAMEIPVDQGSRMTFDSFSLVDHRGLVRDELLLGSSLWKPGAPYSQEKLRQMQTHLARTMRCDESPCDVLTDAQADGTNRGVHVEFRASPLRTRPIRRIEFAGHHRFPEAFYRRRLRLAEGDAYDAEKLRQGLAAIARDGFVQPVRAEDVDTEFDATTATVDVHIRVREAGRRRISLVGGVSTIGMAYNLFNFFGGDELITGHLEGGPPSLQILLHVAKAGLLQDRGAVGLSLFHTLLRPRLPGGRGQRLFTSASTGITQSFKFAPAPAQAVEAHYQFSSTALSIPAASSSTSGARQTHFSGSEIGARWLRGTDATRLHASGGAAGGWLGGGQDLWRVAGQAEVLRRDPLTNGRAQWAARLHTQGVFPAPWGESHEISLSEHLVPGGEVVRGMRPGELSPLRDVSVPSAGVHLVQALNLEYRFSLDGAARHFELTPFADAGGGWLLERVKGTAFRAAIGLELRVRLPETVSGARFPLAGDTLRVHYALAPWLASGMGRKAAWGWALGSLF